jgi:hypothetical protein
VIRDQGGRGLVVLGALIRFAWISSVKNGLCK